MWQRNIRWAEPAQWTVIRSLRERMLADCPDAFLDHGEPGWEEERWLGTFETGGWLLGEVRAERAPVAVARSSVLESGSGERYLESVWVDPRFRRRGLARDLVTEVKLRAMGEGAASIRLAVLDANRPTEAVFGALGFVLMPKVLHDGERDFEFTLPSAEKRRASMSQIRGSVEVMC